MGEPRRQFYRLIAGVLFAFDTPLPDGERAPF